MAKRKTQHKPPPQPRISPNGYDGAAAWALLDAETQAKIGAVALEFGAATYAEYLASYQMPAVRAAKAASERAALVLFLDWLAIDDASTLPIEDEHGLMLPVISAKEHPDEPPD